MDAPRRIVQFGAGNIGRSLVGQLFSRAGWEVVFVDADERIVEALRSRGSYTVVVKDDLPPGEPAEIRVEAVTGLHARDTDAVAEAVASCDMVGTAVGGAVLPKIAPTLAAGLAKRTGPLDCILCENVRDAAALMRRELAAHMPEGFPLDARAGLVNTSIGKMVPIMPGEVRERDPLEVWAERYNRIIADAEGFVRPPPEIEGLVLKANFQAYVDRKLFIHNGGHAAAAYHGFLAGKTCLWECMETPAVRAEAEGVMWEGARALIDAYPGEFDEANQREHIEDLLARFHNKALGDSVFRVGRDLPRKLGPEDRLVGGLRFVRARGGEPVHIRRAIAAALHFAATDEAGRPFPPDVSVQDAIRSKGPEAVLREVSGLDPAADRADLDAILATWRALAPA
jgi:mannitol-1-phosphate 5-dehydrogenase